MRLLPLVRLYTLSTRTVRPEPALQLARRDESVSDESEANVDHGECISEGVGMEGD